MSVVRSCLEGLGVVSGEKQSFPIKMAGYVPATSEAGRQTRAGSCHSVQPIAGEVNSQLTETGPMSVEQSRTAPLTSGFAYGSS